MPLNTQEAILELSTAWKFWAKEKLSNAGQALNIAQQFKSAVGNNPKDASTHEIDDKARQALINYWQTWNPKRQPNPNTLSYRDKNGNYYNVEGSVSGGKGVIHFVFAKGSNKFNWHFKVV